MTAPAKAAMGLWAILAVMVFSVMFDVKTRMAGFDFIQAQSERRAVGAPLDTIENGFRPLVRDAARQSAVWLLVVLAGGAGAVVIADRRKAKDAS